MSEIIGVAAAALQCAMFVGKAVIIFNEYKDAGKHYNKNVDELHSKLKTFRSTLESLGAIAERIESLNRHKKSEANDLLRMQKGLDESRETLKALFDRKDELRKRGTGSDVRLVVRYWFYNNEGKDDVDRAVNAIVDRMDTIKTALLSLNTQVTFDSRELICQICDRTSSTRAYSYASTPSTPSTSSTSETDLDRLIEEDSVSHTSGLSDAMISAIEKEEYKVVARLLESGEDPLVEDENGWCAFHYAVRAGSKRVMRQLLGSKKVNGNKGVLEQRNRDGVTPLHFASSTGMTAMAKELLNAGADKNAVDNHNRSPLFVAVKSNKVDIVELLWDHEAKFIPSKPDRFKMMHNTILNRKSIASKTKKA